MPASALTTVGTHEVNGRLVDKDGGQPRHHDHHRHAARTPMPSPMPATTNGSNPGDTVTLDGTGSSDPDSDPFTYSWAQTAGPGVTLTGASTASPTFFAPSSGTLAFVPPSTTTVPGPTPTPTRS